MSQGGHNHAWGKWPQTAPLHLPPGEDAASACTFALDFLGSGTVGDKCLLFKPNLLWEFLPWKPKRTKTGPVCAHICLT